ncbi:MAG: amidohydrolase family protein, partial [Eubacteriales bacterium]|nr:amidohydrolase family protein [Eubacteriales bacterium]
SVCPTTLASGIDELKGTFETFRRAKKMNKDGARFLGMHLEGPYFALSQKGAQDPRFIKNPEPEEYKKILEWTGDIIRWSAAPELEGALEFAEYLRAKGILPSIAHTDATYEQVLKAFDSGFTHITHFYNATSGVRKINAYRYAGVIESGYLIDDMTVEVIADGCHLPGSLLKLVYKIKGSEKTALVTDSMRAAGMPEGESILGSLKEGQRVLVEDGVAKMPDRTSFAGSVATTDRLVRTMVRQAGVPLTEAVKMMTQTPAKIIGASERIGSLSKGYNADLVVFDKDINIKTVILDGIVVYEV